MSGIKSRIKGIILAGGSGTRLFPATMSVSKQLLPVYDKPMIYYPLSTLMLAGIREILIITTPADEEQFKRLLGDGSQWGLDLHYAVQPSPDGLAQAFILGEDFIGDDPVALILGDNIFHGNDLGNYLRRAATVKRGATLFICQASDPERFGIVTLDHNHKPVSLEEKPEQPESNWAVTGLYFYDNEVVSIAKNLKPSRRGELEITDLNRVYLERGTLNVERLGRGYTWMDIGTHDALLDAAEFVRLVEKRQGLKIACIEEIALLMGFITAAQLKSLSADMRDSPYSHYLSCLAARLGSSSR